MRGEAHESFFSYWMVGGKGYKEEGILASHAPHITFRYFHVAHLFDQLSKLLLFTIREQISSLLDFPNLS